MQLHARCRLEGAPLFSLLSDAGWLLAGTAAKDVVRMRWSELAASAAAAPRVERACSGHTGWVRALSTDGRCVFSVGCNFVRCWDAETLAPMGQERLFSGDVSALACFGGVAYSGGADGSLRAYAVDAAERPAVRLKQTLASAHGDRVEALAVCSSRLVSCGRDGALRVWRPDTLALEHEVLSAHGAGSRVQCLATSGDGVLLTGGSDGCVQRWRCAADSGALEAAGVGATASGVRALLSFAGGGCISGHQDGTLRVWL
jgi:WD40 repeat protein